MKAFMTSGTYSFLKSIEKKHRDKNFFFMRSGSSTLAYYEDRGKSIFVAGRAYHILISKGDISKKGFVVMNNIPITEEGQPVFENRFKNRQQSVESMPGFKAFRLLKPLKGHTYIVLTQWSAEVDYNQWKESDSFKQAHQNETIKHPAYFADRPFLTTYHMVKEENDE